MRRGNRLKTLMIMGLLRHPGVPNSDRARSGVDSGRLLLPQWRVDADKWAGEQSRAGREAHGLNGRGSQWGPLSRTVRPDSHPIGPDHRDVEGACGRPVPAHPWRSAFNWRHHLTNPCPDDTHDEWSRLKSQPLDVQPPGCHQPDEAPEVVAARDGCRRPLARWRGRQRLPGRGQRRWCRRPSTTRPSGASFRRRRIRS